MRSLSRTIAGLLLAISLLTTAILPTGRYDWLGEEAAGFSDETSGARAIFAFVVLAVAAVATTFAIVRATGRTERGIGLAVLALAAAYWAAKFLIS